MDEEKDMENMVPEESEVLDEGQEMAEDSSPKDEATISPQLIETWTELLGSIESTLQDMASVHNGQIEQVKKLSSLLAILPQETEKLQNACAQAEVVCQEMPKKVQEDTTKIYTKSIREAQNNSNSFVQQLDVWLKKREEKKDITLRLGVDRKQNVFILISVLQTILLVIVSWKLIL